MNHFNVCIAGHVIRLETLHAQIQADFVDYPADGTPEFCVHVEQRDIEAARMQSSSPQRDDPRYDLILEKQALHRLLTERLLDEDILLLHGAVIAVEDQAFLFTAPSGTGKTYQIYHWLINCPDAFVVNGDKPFIRFSDDGTPPLACGSPWAGKENLYTNTMVPLKAIVLMERTENHNHIEQISFASAFPTLLQQTYRPEDADKTRKTLQLLRRLDPAVSFWRFRFDNFKPDCFTTAYRALTGREP